MKHIQRLVQKMINPLERRIYNMVARGVITVVNRATKVMSVQASLMDDEITEKAEFFQQYGYTSAPPAGTECIAIFWGGNRDHPIIIATENRGMRKTDLEEGDSAIYTGQGNYIRLQYEDGKIYIDAPHNIILRSDETIRLDARRIELHADEMIKWDVAGRGYDYGPLSTNTYENCTVPGSANDCVPPEHGTIAT